MRLNSCQLIALLKLMSLVAKKIDEQNYHGLQFNKFFFFIAKLSRNTMQYLIIIMKVTNFIQKQVKLLSFKFLGTKQILGNPNKANPNKNIWNKKNSEPKNHTRTYRPDGSFSAKSQSSATSIFFRHKKLTTASHSQQNPIEFPTTTTKIKSTKKNQNQGKRKRGRKCFQRSISTPIGSEDEKERLRCCFSENASQTTKQESNADRNGNRHPKSTIKRISS